ncbi:hypothetical protein [Acinetobacter indicus]|uniref:hypothetical protein n=1 Tax=Acinetobacter indicus TaxID=756892 RepID=UPI001443C5ED|nr:hypothetical protein [Acinetobacter indicus]
MKKKYPFLFIFLSLILSGCVEYSGTSSRDIHEEVVNDTIIEYEISKKHGDLVDICSAAGLVAIAQLQAQNEDGYKEWKRIEKIECDRFEKAYE